MKPLEENKAAAARLGGVSRAEYKLTGAAGALEIGRSSPDEEIAAAPVGAGEGRPRLLIAEDDPVIRNLLEFMLTQKGFAIDCVADGEEAMGRLHRKGYDLALIDLQMPKKDGFEVTRAVRSREAAGGAHMPIVALTAHAYQADQRKCIDAGMDAYVAKPFNFQELFAVIQGFLDPRTARKY